jgi:hypothetical protein
MTMFGDDKRNLDMPECWINDGAVYINTIIEKEDKYKAKVSRAGNPGPWTIETIGEFETYDEAWDALDEFIKAQEPKWIPE